MNTGTPPAQVRLGGAPSAHSQGAGARTRGDALVELPHTKELLTECRGPQFNELVLVGNQILEKRTNTRAIMQAATAVVHMQPKRRVHWATI